MSTPVVTDPALSATGRRWHVALTPAHWRAAAALGQQTGLPLVVAQLLTCRGITTPQAAEIFLNPRLDQLPDPLTLKDADRAVALLADALINRKKIAIFGDYDVDGTCATAILARYLRALGHEPCLYIPDRLTEGYGPNPTAMETIAGQGVQLLVTVDTGTNAPTALQRAAELDLTVIVTDHHPPASKDPADLPLYGSSTAAILNPHRPDDTSGLTMLCGSGVVFFLLMALNRHLRTSGYFTETRQAEPRLTALLDLVALATVADVMPLTDANRVLVTRGLQQLASGQHVGLKALLEVAGHSGPVDVQTLGFQLGPRLNAAGRIDSARLALDLLLTDNSTDATRAAQRLDDKNRERRALEKTVLAAACAQVDALDLDTIPILVVYQKEWHPGVVGIVASRLKEKYSRPAFVLGHDGTHAKGSGRSLPGLDLGAALASCQEHLVSGGGHAMAAGLTLDPANLPAFITALVAACWNQINANPLFIAAAATPLTRRLQPALSLDAILTPAAATPQLVAALAQLAPYGQGHPEPLLALTGCVIGYCKTVGADGTHLKLSLSGDHSGPHGSRLDAICFSPPDTLANLLSHSAGKPLTLVGHLRSRVFNNRTYLDFQIRDAHANWQDSSLTKAA